MSNARNLANLLGTNTLVQPSNINLAGTFAFTGTVSGASGFDLVASGSTTTDASSLDISTDYSGYNHFFLTLTAKGTSTNTSHSWDFTLKRAGETSFDTGSSDYSCSGINLDSGSYTNRNQNSQATGEFFFNNESQKDWSLNAWLYNFGNTERQLSCVSTATKVQSGGNATYFMQSGYNGDKNLERVIEMSIFFQQGNIDNSDYRLYGIK